MLRRIVFISTLTILLAPPARADDAADLRARLSQVEAEDAALQVEMKTILARVGALEEALRARPAAPSATAQKPLAAWEASPEALARELMYRFEQSWRASDKGDVVAALRDLYAFDGGVLPASVDWAKIGGTSLLAMPPGRDELDAVVRDLRSRWFSITIRGIEVTHVPDASGALARVTIVASSAALDPESFTVLTLRVGEGWRLARLATDYYERQTRRMLERIREKFKRGELQQHAHDWAGNGTDGGMRLQGGGYLVWTKLFYDVELHELANGEWTGVATPRLPGYPTLLMGPVPGEFDPAQNPYVVRVRDERVAASRAVTWDASPEELAQELFKRLQLAHKERQSADAAVGDLAAESDLGPYIPNDLWLEVGGAPGRKNPPSRDEVLVVVSSLRWEVDLDCQLRAAPSVVSQSADGRAARVVLEITSESDKSPKNLTMVALRTSAGWRIVHVGSELYERLARKALQSVHREELAGTKHWGPGDSSGSSDSFYKFYFHGRDGGDWIGKATPILEGYPTLVIGPVDGEASPPADPYVVRVFVPAKK